MSITDFLLARIAEDETLARAAIQPSEMYPYGNTRLPATPAEGWGDDVRGYLGGAWGEHCAQHDPTRVLRECAAKRAIITFDQDHQIWCPRGFGDDTAAEAFVQGGPKDPQARHVTQILAAAYSDHPDYQQEWKA